MTVTHVFNHTLMIYATDFLISIKEQTPVNPITSDFDDPKLIADHQLR